MRSFWQKTQNLTKMKVLKLTNLFSLAAVLLSFGAQAQSSSNHGSKDVVMYDPLFWKDELSLKNNQSRKIEQINTEFYENIRQNSSDGNHEANSTTLERGLQERSQKIFETLLPKQRRKLEKIIDKTAPVTAP